MRAGCTRNEYYAGGFLRRLGSIHKSRDNVVLTAEPALSFTDWAGSSPVTGYRVKILVARETEPGVLGLFADDQTTVTIVAHTEARDSAEIRPHFSTEADWLPPAPASCADPCRLHGTPR